MVDYLLGKCNWRVLNPGKACVYDRWFIGQLDLCNFCNFRNQLKKLSLDDWIWGVD